MNNKTILNQVTNGTQINTTLPSPHEPFLKTGIATTFFILYIVVFVFGFIGNILSIVVIVTRREMRRSIHLYTFNLCVSDLLLLVFYVPTQLIQIGDDLAWTMGDEMCHLSYVVIPTALVTAIGTLLCISVDRARGLLRPFKWRADSRKTAKILIPVVWLCSLLINCPLFFITVLSPFINGSVICIEKWPSKELRLTYWIGVFVVTYAVPLIVIFIIQIFIIYIIKYKIKNPKFRKQNKRMFKMTVGIVVTFAVCTGVQQVSFFIFLSLQLDQDTFLALYCASNFLVAVQAAVNPVLYGKFRKDFNRGYKSIFHKVVPKRMLLSAFFEGLVKKEQPKIRITAPSTDSLNSFFLPEQQPDELYGASYLEVPDVFDVKLYRYATPDSPIVGKRTRKNIPEQFYGLQVEEPGVVRSVFLSRFRKSSISNYPLFDDLKTYLKTSTRKRIRIKELIDKSPETNIL